MKKVGDVEVFSACHICGEPMNSQKIVFIWGYDMWVHKACFDLSKEGWATGESRILEHLKNAGIPIPPRNSNGLLPRDYPPPPRSQASAPGL